VPSFKGAAFSLRAFSQADTCPMAFSLGGTYSGINFDQIGIRQIVLRLVLFDFNQRHRESEMDRN
jgi:hypothetical protein